VNALLQSPRRAWARVAVGTAVLVALGLGLAGARPAGAEDDEVTAARTVLVEAATSGEAARLQAALERADALVGPGASFPTQADLADWLGSLPPPVASRPAVRLRRAWLYVAGKRGKDALPLLEEALGTDPKSAWLRAYVGEAKRQVGDVDGAVAAWSAALAAGATDDQVLPSVRKLVWDLYQERARDPTSGLPRYATVVAPLLATKAMPDVEEQLFDWLTFDAAQDGVEAARATTLRQAALPHLMRALRAKVADADRPRLAGKALATARAGWFAGAAAGEGMPTDFDVLAEAVRLGERAGGEGHEVPAALTALAEVALAKGRYVLAGHLARRRLANSDSPGARRVLEQLPADLGD
jgi:tetratricopeptide (TPR) repeat protein